MVFKGNLAIAEFNDVDKIYRSFNSAQFLKNGIRRQSLAHIKSFEDDGFLFNFRSGCGFLLFRNDSGDEILGIVKIDSDLKNLVTTVSGGVLSQLVRQGIGTDFFYWVLNFIFENYPVRRVESNVLVTNKGSLKLHRNLGFVEEGIKRKAWFCNGQLNDQVIYGLLREEFHCKKHITYQEIKVGAYE